MCGILNKNYDQLKDKTFVNIQLLLHFDCI